MHAMILMPLALVAGCVYHMPHHHDHDRGDEWDAWDEPSDQGVEGAPEDEKQRQPGLWMFSVSEPYLEGNCDGVELGSEDAAVIEGLLRHTEDGELIIETDLLTLVGEQDGPSVFAYGTMTWGDRELDLYAEGQARQGTWLEGVVVAEAGGGCLASGRLEAWFAGQ